MGLDDVLRELLDYLRVAVHKGCVLEAVCDSVMHCPMQFPQQLVDYELVDEPKAPRLIVELVDLLSYQFFAGIVAAAHSIAHSL